ncbi:glutamate--tRNA ligase [Candidatus Nomurabacteria bacterium RIFCSPLOWO2_01_FULL_39_18]|uniref:Glutamate--tRNA ligase n=1 Tax=Candidatus Nomurabacteria bacterium RIFCSPHIGHO2_01_FULL_40_24b TaxID=1801739 RepID=A0A1F6V6J7_9BACT|nr:MAG: glutamate--tRNA ligase [Candidatus Nomurabacteria bacterium RIFCSPHIGHO2_01_FULL_40_24b]OGI89246.1 MAG: glutamate--tRNA ligase [Candidatus Nomurabacteria bacterium RIFCSPLOWO2_01_FULL_39_18]
MEDKKVVTRFAPSPTGFMHVGSVRTALFAWLWARKNNGIFILRIEDTDKKREVEGSIEHIMETLRWLGLDYDAGPDKCEPGMCYTQSERLEIYKKYANILIKKGFAYSDVSSLEEIEQFRKKAEEEKRAFLFREHRPENPPEWKEGFPLRFKIKEPKRTVWHDAVRGELTAGPEALDDFILIKSDGYPTYNFAHIVDDIEMGITHVVRGQEFISSTPNYIAVYEALEAPQPTYVTAPPIMGEEGNKKMGKREGAKDVLEYRNEGYLPEAMFNFLALLGWNPGSGDNREVMSREEIVESFDLTHIQKSGAQFNEEKLDWINKEHIKKLSPEQIEKNILEWLPEGMKNSKLVPVVLERISKWGDVKDIAERGKLDLFFETPEIQREKLIFKNSTPEKISENIKIVIQALGNIDENNFTTENVKDALMLVANMGESRGEVLHPVRYALSGSDKSPDPFIIASIIGKNETISRLQKAI